MEITLSLPMLLFLMLMTGFAGTLRLTSSVKIM